jgi:hypothetical protein
MNATETQWIPTSGLPPQFGLALAASAVGIVLGVVITLSLQSIGGPLPLWTLLELFSILGAVVAFALISTWLQTPRRVGIASHGVVLRYSLNRVDIPWSDLMNVRFVSPTVVVFQPLSNQKGRREAFWITPGQAKAILEDPRCPPVTLPDTFRRDLFAN